MRLSWTWWESRLSEAGWLGMARIGWTYNFFGWSLPWLIEVYTLHLRIKVVAILLQYEQQHLTRLKRFTIKHRRDHDRQTVWTYSTWYIYMKINNPNMNHSGWLSSAWISTAHWSNWSRWTCCTRTWSSPSIDAPNATMDRMIQTSYPLGWFYLNISYFDTLLTLHQVHLVAHIILKRYRWIHLQLHDRYWGSQNWSI